VGNQDAAPDFFGPPVIRQAGDMGILVEFGAIYDPVINAAVLAFDAAFDEDKPAGVLETVPSFRSFLIRFDPFELPYARLEQHLTQLLARENWYRAPPPQNRKEWVLPVVYGGSRGPDLGEVADMMGRREDQVIAEHCAGPLNVAMLGFSPGLAYLGQLPPAWGLPRRSEITPQVPAGAVLVAVRQTVLPSTAIPTGWRQIGQTPFRAFDPAAKVPFLVAPGDRIRFEPVTEAAYAAFDMTALRREGGR